MNKAIYMPKGKAGEYAKYACNFYRGCSNGCTYCYLKRGVLQHALGADMPILKTCFNDEHDAIRVYFNELTDPNVYADIMKQGVFFTFTSDPCLAETIILNSSVMCGTMDIDVPVQMLTKCAKWIHTDAGLQLLEHPKASELLSVGFTLTGMDYLEPNASTNAERVEAMKRIHDMGIRTWASVEPVIDIEASKRCIANTLEFCNEYKIGLLSGGKRGYTKEDVQKFVEWVENAVQGKGKKVYLKESVRNFIK